MFSEEDKKELRELLESKKKNIEDQLGSLHKQAEFGNDVDSFDEESDESEAHSNIVAIEETLKHHLHHIEDALGRLEKGEYGKCKECGHEISIKLLKFAPESLLCQNCKVNLKRNL